MDADFARALEWVLRWEGGYVDHPADRGGATNRGITQATYDAWRIAKGLPVRSVKHLEDAECEAIYRTRYWEPCLGPQTRWPLCLATFDFGVHSGPRRALDSLAEVLGCQRPELAMRVSQVRPEEAAVLLCARRLDYLRGLVERDPRQRAFWRGWRRRVDALVKECAK